MNSLSFSSSFIVNTEPIKTYTVYLQINMVKYSVEWEIMRNNEYQFFALCEYLFMFSQICRYSD